MTQLELLEDTVKYYSEDVTRRNLSSTGVCKYFPQHANTQGCAIGRLISRTLCKGLDEQYSTILADVFDELPLNVKKYGSGFLEQLQILHDTRYYWGEDGMTEDGKEFADRFRRQVIEGVYESGLFSE